MANLPPTWSVVFSGRGRGPEGVGRKENSDQALKASRQRLVPLSLRTHFQREGGRKQLNAAQKRLLWRKKSTSKGKENISSTLPRGKKGRLVKEREGGKEELAFASSGEKGE